MTLPEIALGATASAGSAPATEAAGIKLLGEYRPEVLALAEVVSPAAYVEPALLRRARYSLVPQAGAETEADLWLGPLVTPTRLGLVFTVAALPHLRARLAADTARLNAATDLVRRMHVDAAPSVRLEEEIIRLCLSDSADSAMEQRLAAVAAAMVQQPARATDIARWLMLTLPRLPDRARRLPAAWALSLRAGEQLGTPSPLRQPPSEDLGPWRSFASVRRPDRAATTVHLVDDGLRLNPTAAPGGSKIAVPPTKPRVLEVGTPGSRMVTVTFRDGEQRHVPVSILRLWPGPGGGTAGELGLSWAEKVTAFAVAADGGAVAVGFQDGRVELRDAQTGALRYRQDLGVQVTALATTGTRVLSGTSAGAVMLHLDNDRQIILAEDDPVAALAVAETASYAVAVTSHGVASFTLPSGERLARETFEGRVTAVAVHGSLVALVTDGTVYLTDPTLATVRALTSEVPAERLAALSDSQLAVLGSDKRVRRWSTSDGQLLGMAALAAGPVVDLAAAGGTLLTAGTDRLLRGWAGPDLAQESGRRRYDGQVRGLAGAASASLAASISHGGPLTLRSLAGSTWRLEAAIADDGPLGAQADGNGTRFAVFAGMASAVQVCLVGDGGERRIELEPTGEGIWQGYVHGIQPGQRYGYRVSGPDDHSRGLWSDPGKLLLDPYATAVAGRGRLRRTATGAAAAMGESAAASTGPAMLESVVSDPRFDWGSDTPPATPLQNTLIYEAHVKGLTQRHPEIPPEIRGTYAAVAHPVMLEHYTRLGITAIQLMPVHQFVHEDWLLRSGLSNYWGYNTICFFAPHDEYSSAGVYGEQVIEFKTMVRNLHAAGIEVYLDVVYNHTAEGDHAGPMLSFRGLDNLAYYRTEPGNPGKYVDATGGGNSLNIYHPRVLQLILESMRYWAREMHIDGLRFDLASVLGKDVLNFEPASGYFELVRRDPVLSRVKLIAGRWAVGAGGYQVGKPPRLWVEWNGDYRDTVRDYWRSRNSGGTEIATRLAGSPDLYPVSGPSASVNYVTCHDGFTLEDLVSYNEKHNEANGEQNRDGPDDNRSWNCGVEGPTSDSEILALRERQKRNFLATLLLSRGIPMLLAGDEMRRTQHGNNNAWSQDNELSWLDWSKFAPGRGLDELIARLTRIRREFPALWRAWPPRDVSADADHFGWLSSDGTPLTPADWSSGTLAMAVFLRGEPAEPPDESGPSLLLLLNAWWERLTFSLPGPQFAEAWTVLLDTASDVGRTGAVTSAPLLLSPSERYTAEPRSLVLMRSEKADVGIRGRGGSNDR